MEQLSKLTLSTICYVTEKIDLVRQSMYNILPEGLRTLKLEEYSSTSSFGDKITIINLTVSNKELKPAITYITSKLSIKDKQYLFRHFSKRLDMDEKNFFFRFDKFKLVGEELSLTEGSDVVRVVVGYSTFTIAQNTEENIRNLFLNEGLIAK